jgi:hypothetical protein
MKFDLGGFQVYETFQFRLKSKNNSGHFTWTDVNDLWEFLVRVASDVPRSVTSWRSQTGPPPTQWTLDNGEVAYIVTMWPDCICVWLWSVANTGSHGDYPPALRHGAALAPPPTFAKVRGYVLTEQTFSRYLFPLRTSKYWRTENLGIIIEGTRLNI